ncbi:hypothetical protein CO2235_MP10362 [Cupriavidus oxalaticus]|uniref:Uncharacterized protein n=1 Tax=Cupriavidus oxalaticus TaxID=96344 RepID=A0A375FG29_9BURK|nr:hypothetical protein CO2235_U1010071 [Cupriavidus oxalaticus]SPC18158.1 hypothetical protein CO2235_MP10362 [Cupriavidus oxalaticus]
MNKTATLLTGVAILATAVNA